MRLLGFFVLGAAWAGACACERPEGFFASAHLIDREGRQVGEAAFVQNRAEHGVRISIRAWGLPPGVHGIHLHELRFCPPGVARPSGASFHFHGREWGLERIPGPPAGDLPDLIVSEAGTVETSVWVPWVTLGRGKHPLLRPALEPGGTCLMIAAESGTPLAGGIVRRFDGRALEEK